MTTEMAHRIASAEIDLQECPTGIQESDEITGDGNLDEDSGDLAAALERAALDQSLARYVLTLYVMGLRPRSQQAIANVRHLCEEHLAGRYELRIVDI